MDYTAMILEKLLDKYERSAHYYHTARINRRICFNIDRQTMPAYITGEDPVLKETLHQAVREMSERELITVEWVRGETNNLLEKVCLNLEQIEEAYTRAGRKPKRALISEMGDMLGETAAELRTPWISAFLAKCRETVVATLELPRSLPSGKGDLALLLQALRGLDHKGEDEMLERVFSIRYLGDSKVFTRKVKSPLIAVAREGFLQDPDLAAEDVLHELGIVKTTEELLLAGPLRLAIKGRTVDFTPLDFGAVIDTQVGDSLQIAGLEAEKVLLVENKTNYHALLRRGLSGDLLLIYLGGFPGPRKRRFLARLYVYCREQNLPVQFLHWGDIDWGGLRIHQILKEQAFPTLKPLFMDCETLLAHRHMAEQFPDSYRHRLEKLKQSPRYSHFHALIDLMCAQNIRLEQEALLADPNFCWSGESGL